MGSPDGYRGMNKTHCNFCRACQDDVTLILLAPGDLAICDECVELSVKFIVQREPSIRERFIEAASSA